MTTSTVFTNNCSQAMGLPADLRFPDSIKKVEVRAVGQERIIAPVGLISPNSPVLGAAKREKTPPRNRI